MSVLLNWSGVTSLMDSELTLVNPAPPTSYYLSNSDLTNVLIYAHPSAPLYRITGDSKHIRITDATTPNRIIAVLHRRGLLSDIISFPHRNGGAQIRVHKWLRKSKLTDGSLSFTVETEYGPYVWKVTSRYRQKIYTDYDLEKPVASCCLHYSLPHDKPAFMLESVAEPVRDDLVVAYLVQRHRVMIENKALDLFVDAGYLK